MARTPSIETELKSEKRMVKRLRSLLDERGMELLRERAKTTRLEGERSQALQQAAEWRKRFDDLLARVPVAAIKAE